MVETRWRRPLRGRLRFWHRESGGRQAGEPTAHRTVATSTPSRISEQGAPTDDSNQSIRGETEMERVLERCCALDVHKRQVTACVHVPDQQGRRSELRAEFQTMTSELLALRDWLQGLGVTHVAMEATGVYWKPVYYLLEDDFELWLVRASFVPPKPIRELRDLPAIASRSSGSARVRPTACRSCSRTPTSSSPRSRPARSASPAGRCSPSYA